MNKNKPQEHSKQFNQLFEMNYPSRFQIPPPYFPLANYYRQSQYFRKFNPLYYSPSHYSQFLKQNLLLRNGSFQQRNFNLPYLGPPISPQRKTIINSTSQVKIQPYEPTFEGQPLNLNYLNKTHCQQNQVQSVTNYNLLNERKNNRLNYIAQNMKKEKIQKLEETKNIRKLKVLRYLEKKKYRNFDKKITYKCRKNVADQRIRFKGRFMNVKQSVKMLGLDPKQDYSLQFIKEQLKKRL